MKEIKCYTEQEVNKKSLEYFGGDELATSVFVKKYALKNKDGLYEELTPDDMHDRLAKEFLRVDNKYPNPKKYEDFREVLDHFKYVIPGGSVMYGAGNDYIYTSLSNCFIPGTKIFTVNRGTINIEDAEINDVVISHKNNKQKIIQLHKNYINENIFSFKCYKTPTIQTTMNHQFWSITKEQLQWGEAPQWNKMEYLREGDYIAIPNYTDGKEDYELDLTKIIDNIDFISNNDNVRFEIQKSEDYINLVSFWHKPSENNKIEYNKNHNLIKNKWLIDSDFAYFMGLWYGDGCIFSSDTKNNVLRGITFTFHKNETENIEFVSKYGEKLLGIKSDVNYHNIDNDNSVQIVFNSMMLAHIFHYLFGKGFDGKHLWEEMYDWSKRLISDFATGLVASDGFVTRTGSVRVVLKNPDLIRDIYNLLRKCGITSGYSETIGGSGTTKGPCSRLIFTNKDNLFNKLSKSYDDDRINIAKNKNNKESYTKIINNIVFVRINIKRKIEYQGYVYNIGVENDHSYIVDGVVCKNCVVLQNPLDSVSEIMNTGKNMANLFKYRSGIGICIDELRPEGSPVNNSAGTSTGAWTFTEYFSNISKMIGQNGRRAALLVGMSVKHPDIEKFVTMKRDLTKVTGANISVMVTDDFINAVNNDKEWVLQWPVDVSINDAKFTKKISAKELWYLICESAVKYAEPGIIFVDNYANNLPAHEYPGFKSICTNPCGEVYLSKNDTCRLTSINLSSFITNPFLDNTKFNYKKLEEITRISMRILDNIVDLEIEKLTQIKNKSDHPDEKKLWTDMILTATNGRRTGLGVVGVADALAMLKIKYASEDAIKILHKIFETIRNSAYDESVNLSIERGAFPSFDWDLERNNIFINRLPKELQVKISQNGRRNISLLTVPPTGSIAIIAKLSSGIEPVFNNSYTRRVKMNKDVKDTGNNYYTDESGDTWYEFDVLHQNISRYLEVNPDIKTQFDIMKANKKSVNQIIKEILPDYFVTAHEIDPMKRVEIQGVISSYLDHGISSTVNLPASTSIETGQNIYMLAHKLGCKGMTIYVDGSRSGVLINKESNPTNAIIESIAPKRPKELPCEIHHSTIDDNKWTIFVGLLDGRPYEMFGGLSEYVTIPKRYKNGKIVKVKNGKKNVNGRYAFYNLIIDDSDDDPLEIQNIAVTFNDGNYAAQTRMISLALRHGVPVQYIAEQLGRDENSHFFSFSKVMARVLKKYIDDGVESSENCEECGAKLVFEGGCNICKICGYSSKCN